MKLLYTFLIIFSFALGADAQSASVAVQNSGSDFSVTAPSLTISKVYPNPVKEKVNIIFRSDKSGDVQIALINILGSVVKTWEPFFVSAGERSTSLDLSEIKSGVYVLKITRANQVATQLLKKY